MQPQTLQQRARSQDFPARPCVTVLGHASKPSPRPVLGPASKPSPRLVVGGPAGLQQLVAVGGPSASASSTEASVQVPALTVICSSAPLRHVATAPGLEFAMGRLREDAPPMTAGMEQTLDKLRKEQAALVAELHMRRLQRQTRAVQGELETETLLAQLQQAQLEVQHKELKGEMQRASRKHAQFE